MIRKQKVIVLLQVSVLITGMVIGGCAKQPTTPEHPSRNVRTGVKISSAVTSEQIDFINANFDYVMTSFLSNEVREKVQGPSLLLYRSIQSTWTGFNQLDWSHIDANENMFCHHDGKRIRTVYDSWLMDGCDLVDSDSPSAQNHWVNYYAVTSSGQVHEFNYDGLFIDEASHRLSPGVVYRLMPDGYSDSAWRHGRYAALEFIKSYFPDKLVVFNGLHSSSSAEHGLSLTDGGMWETFAFDTSDGKYAGEAKWKEVIELTERNNGEKSISIVSKKEGLTSDIQSRMFVLTSYLLVSNKNVVLYMSDLSYDTSSILYYPEYKTDLGAALGGYAVKDNGIYERRFEKGIVLVNPSATESFTYTLNGEYDEVVPVDGGLVQEDGSWEGSITHEVATGKITLPPVSGAVLIGR